MLELAKSTLSDDGSSRFVWRLAGGHEVESVLFRTTPASFIQPSAQVGDDALRLPSGVVVCVSSQSGCNVGCPFCATGLQPMRAEQVCGGVRVVFAGMGEPLLNYESVRDAAVQLTAQPEVLNVAISTTGIVPAIQRLAAEAPGVDLYVSPDAGSTSATCCCAGSTTPRKTPASWPLC